MKILNFIFAVILLFPCAGLAETVRSISVFYADDVPVTNDIRLETVDTRQFHNMSTHANTVRKINELIQAKVNGLKVDEKNVKDIYLRAFSDVQNGPHWRGIYEQFERGGMAIEAALRLGVKKLPAVVINQKYVIYGESSVSSAIEVFDRWSEQL